MFLYVGFVAFIVVLIVFVMRVRGARHRTTSPPAASQSAAQDAQELASLSIDELNLRNHLGLKRDQRKITISLTKVFSSKLFSR
jgi:hypothetical protein